MQYEPDWLSGRHSYHLTITFQCRTILRSLIKPKPEENQLMSRKTILASFAAASLVVCALALSGPASAQSSQKQLDIAAARAQRKATVGANMNLTPDEASQFWPVYDSYEKSMDSIEDRHVKELKDFAAKYNNFTEADAKKKLDEVIAIQQARLDVQKDYIPKFRAVIPQVKVTRFYQIDNKIQALIQCDIAQLVPLAQSPSEAAPQ
jgi:hypothetical protein